MKRTFDLGLVLALLIVGAIPLIVVALLVKLTSKGPVLYWSDRIGRNNRVFRMPKFRTMRTDTPEVASHLLNDPNRWLTPVGRLLRRTSLDELPQLWSVLVGDMSFVGPRPALHNQDDLIALRTLNGVHVLIPGVTGWAQINGRDETPIPQKVAQDAYYLAHRSIWFDLKIIGLTALQVLRREGTSVPANVRGADQGEEIPAEAFLASAIEWFEQHDYDRAIANYDRVIEVAPDNALACNNRGAAWTAKGEYDKAIADYATAIQLSPDFTVAYHNRGLVWAEMGHGEKAADDFAKVVALIPTDVTSHDAVIEYLTAGRDDRRRDDKGAVLVAACEENLVGWKRLEPIAESPPLADVHHGRS